MWLLLANLIIIIIIIIVIIIYSLDWLIGSYGVVQNKKERLCFSLNVSFS